MFNPILFTRGIESDSFYLILSGKVSVCSGNEGFMITQSAFNYLGAESLSRDDYRPDFSAKVMESARILRITRTKYRHTNTLLGTFGTALNSLFTAKPFPPSNRLSSMLPMVSDHSIAFLTFVRP